MIDTSSAPRRRAKRRNTTEFGLLYAVGFVFFLATTIVGRVARLFTGRRGEPRRSIIQEARDTTGRTIPYAFMG
jgi:hypothetical protein